ncbi:hypothetical protein HGG78_18460 [Vibrio aestuarianus]|uniref:hypothetical protein n=1 Tax=Vibrio aestuarianus TaxID=28171 RepID=UPI001558681F|nr:hypothetical protein [Vibrio aestuarianus]NGZ15692.1 hypothetical protein [Vibrio aestuarianus]NKZ51840.1 hypothetical protein [Vibrio aestuarianus]
MTLNPTFNLNDDQRKWLDELVSNQVKDLGIYIRSLKRLNDFASIVPDQPQNQQFIDEFLNTYLFNLVSTNELKPNTAKAYYNVCFRFITWVTSDNQLKKQNFGKIFSNVVIKDINQELDFNILFSEKNAIDKCSIEFKLIVTITLREKNLRIEDVISLSIDDLGLIQNIKLRSALKNYIFSNRRFSRLEKVRNELPNNKVFYSQRGELFSLDSFRSRLSDLNKVLNNNNVHITSKVLRQFSITDEEVCVLISGIINE